MQQKNTI